MIFKKIGASSLGLILFSFSLCHASNTPTLKEDFSLSPSSSLGLSSPPTPSASVVGTIDTSDLSTSFNVPDTVKTLRPMTVSKVAPICMPWGEIKTTIKECKTVNGVPWAQVDIPDNTFGFAYFIKADRDATGKYTSTRLIEFLSVREIIISMLLGLPFPPKEAAEKMRRLIPVPLDVIDKNCHIEFRIVKSKK